MNYGIHQGVQRSEAERLPLFMSVGSFIGRVSCGKISDSRRCSRITLSQVTFLVQSVAITLCTLPANIGSLIAFGITFGIFDGFYACLLTIVLDDVFVDKNRAIKAIGQLFQFLGIAYALGAPFAGKFNLRTIRDTLCKITMLLRLREPLQFTCSA